MQQLVRKVAERVRSQLQRKEVPPLSSVHGTWQEKGDLRIIGYLGASRIGMNGDGAQAPADWQSLSITLFSNQQRRERMLFGFARKHVNMVLPAYV